MFSSDRFIMWLWKNFFFKWQDKVSDSFVLFCLIFKDGFFEKWFDRSVCDKCKKYTEH